MQWLDLKGIGAFSVPNGFIAGGRNKWGMLNKLRAEGMKKGAPDLILTDCAPKDGRPVAIEMKRATGGSLSGEQIEMIARMRRGGWHVLLAPGVHMAIAQLESLGY